MTRSRSREQEWDAAIDSLAEDGVPIKADRDQAWRDFAGWRVNYDTVLLALASITTAPYATVVIGSIGRPRVPAAGAVANHAGSRQWRYAPGLNTMSRTIRTSTR